jgi:uncharacterized membrane protein (DUF2068 family)
MPHPRFGERQASALQEALKYRAMRSTKTIRAVAYFEALKGALVLVAATGLLSLVHKDLSALAAALVEHTHLNPASKYPEIFLDAATKLQDSRLRMLALGAAAYSTIRFIEAYGLFFERAWAEVLAAASGAIYVPFEVIGLVRKLTWHGGVLLGLNLAVVAIMVFALLDRRARGEVTVG